MDLVNTDMSMSVLSTNYSFGISPLGNIDKLTEAQIQLSQAHRLFLAAQANIRVAQSQSNLIECRDSSKEVMDCKHQISKLEISNNEYKLKCYQLESKISKLEYQLLEVGSLPTPTTVDPSKTNEAGQGGIGTVNQNAVDKSVTEKKLACLKGQLQQLRNAFKSQRSEFESFGDQQKKWLMELTGYYNTLKVNTVQQEELEALRQENLKLRSLYKSEYQMRVKLNDTVQELKGNIRILVRIRPLLEDAAIHSPRSVSSEASGRSEWVGADNSNFIPIVTKSNQIQFHERIESMQGGNPAEKYHTFSFDKVFNPTATQSDVFAEVSSVIISVLDGFNAAIFAYGQTGSGKTHTMIGNEEDGLLFTSIKQLFKLTKQNSNTTYTLKLSIMEVYNDLIYDLLNPLGREKKLDIRQNNNEVVVNCIEAAIDNYEQFRTIVLGGMKNRTEGITNINVHSSRSHCVIKLQVKGENDLLKEVTQGTLYITDLAGSERVNKVTNSASNTSVYSSFNDRRGSATSSLVKETQHINKSLTSLGDVMESLASKSNFVPYRNSKLTHLMQNSLSGNSKVVFIVNISPCRESICETLCSLHFAQRLSKIQFGTINKNVQKTEKIGA